MKKNIWGKKLRVKKNGEEFLGEKSRGERYMVD
jgi:hypothetical protein